MIPTKIQPLIKELKKIETVDKIYFFGSRAKGTHREDSDYDIALISENDDVLAIICKASVALYAFYQGLDKFSLPSVEFHALNEEELENTPIGQEITETGLVL